MPPPNTVEELIDRLHRSGIIPPERWEEVLAATQPSPATPKELLDRLLERELITPFHAEKLAAGKYKGFLIGSYRILDQLGSGGMGQVFLAEHVRMERLVALKILPPAAYDDSTARARFFREARAAAKLDHPNIVRIYDLCEENRILYLVLEYVDGTSLQQIVARHGPLPVEWACDYIRQAAFGLHHAHELGFIHRDIKPANLLLDRHGVIKILDFGLVRSAHDRDGGLTRQLDNAVLGTADYVAPEQAIDSSAVDIRADLYSLGATFYFLLAGHPLFPEGRTTQKLLWQQMREPTPIEQIRPEVPPELAAVIHKLLRKSPQERYQTPAELLEALEPFARAEIPLPDAAWMPQWIGRRRAAHLVASGGGPVSLGGTTSQVVLAALRGGPSSPSGSNPSVHRIHTAAPATSSLSFDETAPMAPSPHPPPAAPAPLAGRWLVAALSVALLLSLGIILYLVTAQ